MLTTQAAGFCAADHPAYQIIAACLLLGWLPASLLLMRHFRRAAGVQLAHAQSLQTQLQVEMFRIGRLDSLTGLPSRAVFLETVSTAFASGRPFALFLIDLDEFSAVNASFGDPTGDDVLRQFAGRLRALAGRREHAARLDGDTFALLTDDAQELKALASTAAKIVRDLSIPCPAGGLLIDVSVSIGVALAPSHGESAEPLLRAASLAQHQARNAGGNRWLVCEQDIILAAQSRHHSRQELKRAIASGEIVPWYQPIMHLSSGRIAKFEVLARWNHPVQGMLTPDQFIPLAEEMGLSGHISMALLRQVATDCRDWPETCRFAFNVSAGQLRELTDLLKSQPGEWQRRMDLSRLDVEITEAALIYDRVLARELIDSLHEHGARAGLDNFGIGNSNFSFLQEMPFDSIKIGKNFIQNLLGDTRAEACVRAMLWLGQGLGVDMVADGVESAETAARLSELGCCFAQGFYYARPTPASGIPDMFDEASLPSPTGSRAGLRATPA